MGRCNCRRRGDEIVAQQWVIISELGLAQARERYDVRMHIALTRATLGCVVVATAEEIAADPRLARLKASQTV